MGPLLTEIHRHSASSLRREISARGMMLAQREQLLHEQTYGSSPAVVFTEDDSGLHGNFFPASWRRIIENPAWAIRLDKTYTASARVPRSTDRWRGELECATSSDALLMNIFCHPQTMKSVALRAALGIGADAVPEFGWRARVELETGHDDRTEVDMRLGDLLVEAKLCEGDFQSAQISMMQRYGSFESTFDIERMKPRRGKLRSYQLLRGVMAAVEHDARFCLMCDARRTDLIDDWSEVVGAVRYSAVRCRLQLITWQEIARHLPSPLTVFLADKYGINAK